MVALSKKLAIGKFTIELNINKNFELWAETNRIFEKFNFLERLLPSSLHSKCFHGETEKSKNVQMAGKLNLLKIISSPNSKIVTKIGIQKILR